jgi:hypothetical protein
MKKPSLQKLRYGKPRILIIDSRVALELDDPVFIFIPETDNKEDIKKNDNKEKIKTNMMQQVIIKKPL